MEPDGPTQPREQVPRTAPSPADQRPAPTTPTEPVSYWAAAPPPERKRTRLLLLVTAWIVAVLFAWFYAVLKSRTSSGGDAFREGWLVGTFLAPFLFALILRVIWTRVVRRSDPGPRPVLGSGWVPLGAVILIGLNFISTAGTLVPPAAIDPNSVVRISPPFTLREASSETAGLAEEALKADKSVRSYAIREVVGEDGSVSMLLVADGALRSGELDGVAKGIQDASGLVPTTQSIGGRDVVVAVSEQIAVGAWIEEPAFISVYAADEATLRAIVEAILRAPRT
jgi:hypothetical protein